MTVKDLKKVLEDVDENLPIRSVRVDKEDIINYWVVSAEIYNTGLSGYELNGEVVLKVSE